MPKVTATEAAPFPEIVMPRLGAYIREDCAGSVYLDRTVVAFFEAHRPYTIKHLKPRPDVTTVISLKDRCALADALGQSLGAVQAFPRSAVRASPFLQRLHRALVGAVAQRPLDVLKAHETAVTLAAEAYRLSADTSVDLSLKTEGDSSRWARDVSIAISEYLNANYARRPSLDDIATFSGYSVFHVCRLFKSQTGMTLNGYADSLRLDAAMAILVETDQTITDIALALGFSSHSHFATQFRKRFGLSPRAARRAR